MPGQADSPASSGIRRRLVRVRADISVVVAFRDGDKLPARVMDVSAGGMYLRAGRTPQYGEVLTVVVRLGEHRDWSLLPATVRWFTSQGFGVAFESLDAKQAAALAAFVDHVAA
jgi:c-di-GMP-binding flagellar brake protein YcgR